MGDTDVDHATGAARRRRERRLRAYLKYARMSVAMALAEANHHTAPRGQKTARAEATNDTSKGESGPGMRCTSSCLTKTPQGCDQVHSWTLDRRSGVPQHTVEHEDAICPFVQILDAPVPQLGEQLVHFFRSLDTQLPVEQVVDVPKISDDSIQPRIVDCDLRCPQIVEQLGGSADSLVFCLAPAADCRAHRRHSSSATVVGGSGGGGLHGFLPEQFPTVFMAEQLVDDPVRGGGLRGFLPGAGFNGVWGS